MNEENLTVGYGSTSSATGVSNLRHNDTGDGTYFNNYYVNSFIADTLPYSPIEDLRTQIDDLRKQIEELKCQIIELQKPNQEELNKLI